MRPTSRSTCDAAHNSFRRSSRRPSARSIRFGPSNESEAFDAKLAPSFVEKELHKHVLPSHGDRQWSSCLTIHTRSSVNRGKCPSSPAPPDGDADHTSFEASRSVRMARSSACPLTCCATWASPMLTARSEEDMFSSRLLRGGAPSASSPTHGPPYRSRPGWRRMGSLGGSPRLGGTPGRAPPRAGERHESTVRE